MRYIYTARLVPKRQTNLNLLQVSSWHLPLILWNVLVILFLILGGYFARQCYYFDLNWLIMMWVMSRQQWKLCECALLVFNGSHQRQSRPVPVSPLQLLCNCYRCDCNASVFLHVGICWGATFPPGGSYRTAGKSSPKPIDILTFDKKGIYTYHYIMARIIA